MMLISFFCIYTYILNFCDGSHCPPFKYNFGNSYSTIRNFQELLRPFKLLFPFYNNVTIPNLEEIIQQYKIGKQNEDVHLNFTQLVTKYGYPVEQHQVITEDKYCLTVFRIPNPGAPVVFLMHGVLCSADDWITAGTKTALAYALADAGYDVWVGNARGNKHSRCHLEKSPDCADFWEFSFDEIGRYDLPAMIDYALTNTGKSKLIYIGHSQGTTAFYVMASERPEYNDKISFMVCLSAVVYMSHVRSPLIQLISPLAFEVEIAAELIGAYEFLPRDAFLNAYTSTFCSSPIIAEIFCELEISALSGFNIRQLNASTLPVIYSHYPAGSSIYQILHYGQEVNSGKFRRYDHGALKNLAKYKSIKPPDYPLNKVTCPMAIFYSKNDWLTSDKDVFQFLKEVPNVVEFYQVPCRSFMHFDYIFAKNSDDLVNNEVLRLISMYADK